MIWGRKGKQDSGRACFSHPPSPARTGRTSDGQGPSSRFRRCNKPNAHQGMPFSPSPAHHHLRRRDLGHHIRTGTAFTAEGTFLPHQYRGGSVPGAVQRTAVPAQVRCSSSSHSQQRNTSTAWDECIALPEAQTRAGGHVAEALQANRKRSPRKAEFCFPDGVEHIWGGSTSRQRGFSSESEHYGSDTLESMPHASSCLSAEYAEKHMACPQMAVLSKFLDFFYLFFLNAGILIWTPAVYAHEGLKQHFWH